VTVIGSWSVFVFIYENIQYGRHRENFHPLRLSLSPYFRQSAPYTKPLSRSFGGAM
jgi:hypothetical protein